MTNQKINTMFIVIIGTFFLTPFIRPSIQIFSILLTLFLIYCYTYFKISKKNIFFLNKNEKMLTIAIALMFFSMFPPMIVNDSLSFGLREFDVPIKYLLLSITALFIFKLKPQISKDILFKFIAFGGILIGLVAVAHIFIFQNQLYHGRFTGYCGINDVGFVCGSFSILNIALYLFYKNKNYFALAGFLSFFGVVGSGLRGVMLGVGFGFVLILILGFFLRKISFKMIVKSSIVFLCLFFLISCIVFNNLPSKRVEYTKSELQEISDGNYNTSIGQRLIMYKEALAIFYLSPIIGMSDKTQFDNAEKISEISGFDEMIKAKEIKKTKDNTTRRKKHNDILTMLSHRGLVGLSCLIFFYFAFINILFRQTDFTVAITGLGFITMCAGVGLSGDPLNGQSESMFFVMVLLTLLCTSKTISRTNSD